MQTSPDGLGLIKMYEGFRADAYQDVAGVWTIGYGHTLGVKEGDHITSMEAGQFLVEDLADAEQAVERLVTIPLAQCQFDALVSWTFNLGQGNLASSTMLQAINRKDHSAAIMEMLRWHYAGGKPYRGLIKRRLSEAQMYADTPW